MRVNKRAGVANLLTLMTLFAAGLFTFATVGCAPSKNSSDTSADVVVDRDDDGTANATDCAPDDATRFQILAYSHVDGDHDGISTPSVGEVCSGISLEPPYHETPTGGGADCNDADPTLNALIAYAFIDLDGDDRFVASSGEACTGETNADTYASVLVEPIDCDDTDATIYQRLTGYHTDTDDDGFGVVPMEQCTGQNLPTGQSPSPDYFPDDGSRSSLTRAESVVGTLIDSTGTYSYYKYATDVTKRLIETNEIIWRVALCHHDYRCRPRNFIVAPDDSVYITGSFQGKVDFDPSIHRDFHESARDEPDGIIESPDGFVTRIGADGSYQWTHVFGGPEHDWGNQIVALSSERILVAARAGNWAEKFPEDHTHPFFDFLPEVPGVGEMNNIFSDDIPVLIEFHPSGSVTSMRPFYDAKRSNIFVVPDGETHFFVFRYKADASGYGSEHLVTRHRTPNLLEAAPGQTATEGAVPACGDCRDLYRQGVTNSKHELYFSGVWDIYHDLENGMKSVGKKDAVAWKMGADLQVQWLRTIGSTLDDQIYDIAVDSRDHVYFGGVVQSTVNFNPGVDSAHFDLEISNDLKHTAILLELDETDTPVSLIQWDRSAYIGHIGTLPGNHLRVVGSRLTYGNLEGLDIDFTEGEHILGRGAAGFIIEY